MKFKPSHVAVLYSLIVFASCKKDQSVPVNPADLIPKMTSISDTAAHFGALVTIKGKNFSKVANENTVKIGGVTATVQAATDTTIQIQIPSLIASGGGAVEVTTAHGSVSGFSFNYLPDVIVAGFDRVNSAANFIAKFWKNDTAVAIANGQSSTYASALFVSGNNILVAANDVTGLNNILWLNSNTSSVPNSGNNGAMLTGVTMSGTDLYAAGYINENGITNAKYWRNGVPVALSNGVNAQANAIAVSGSDVYIGGYESGVGNAKATYWRNGTAVYLTNGSSYAEVRAIALSGTDVLAVGSEVENQREVAKLWRNGVATALSNSPNHVRATAITVVGNDVYIAGEEYTNNSGVIIKYWKNGVPVIVASAGADYRQATGIAVFGNDVYVSGKQQYGGSEAVVYWKNDILTRLSGIGGGADGSAVGISLR